MTLNRDWLMENRNLGHQDIAKRLGVRERDVVRAYYEMCRIPGTPIPVSSSYSSCESCAWQAICRIQERCMCESMQLWENEI